MSDVAIAQAPTRQAIAAKDRSAPRKVTGRLKRALDIMVWVGEPRATAARSAGMTDDSLRSALTKPHVKAYYTQQLEVLRTSERSRNIHRLTEIRDAANNMPAVNAIKALEQIPDDHGVSGSSVKVPGVVIFIGQGAAPAPGGTTLTLHEPNNVRKGNDINAVGPVPHGTYHGDTSEDDGAGT